MDIRKSQFIFDFYLGVGFVISLCTAVPFVLLILKKEEHKVHNEAQRDTKNSLLKKEIMNEEEIRRTILDDFFYIHKTIGPGVSPVNNRSLLLIAKEIELTN